eukprot:CAMPEP_0181250370 /NCGR_PEP_ID=MMETSP1096-20121128/46281_1 /TAXON_ID=156174 ORGANISM="Chrysochromulina ericina, Strain CCMP281" /NCGR_SAMPLE_ID=MMETSP1096 /ASSEMBLY_ACC=CAM_ASM_000453 /LENGTH=379 /DNA_ID=CAMNT_0023347829 /DNA_START=355 /DNA_END=1495 /DNA_ORIENTATION=-
MTQSPLRLAVIPVFSSASPFHPLWLCLSPFAFHPLGVAPPPLSADKIGLGSTYLLSPTPSTEHRADPRHARKTDFTHAGSGVKAQECFTPGAARAVLAATRQCRSWHRWRRVESAAAERAVASAAAAASLADGQDAASRATPSGLPPARATSGGRCGTRPSPCPRCAHMSSAVRLLAAGAGPSRRASCAGGGWRSPCAARAQASVADDGDVRVDGVEAQPPLELHGGDVVVPAVLARYAAHGSHTTRMEAAQPVEDLFGGAPRLRTVEEHGEDEDEVDRLLRLHVDVRRREYAAAQCAKRLARRLDAAVDIRRVAAAAREEESQVAELGDDRDEAAVGQLHVRQVCVVEGRGVVVVAEPLGAEEHFRLGLLLHRAVVAV